MSEVLLMLAELTESVHEWLTDQPHAAVLHSSTHPELAGASKYFNSYDMSATVLEIVSIHLIPL